MSPLDNDKRIYEKFQTKTWQDIKTKDSWGLFKIMSEFVNGYESLAEIGPCVSMFGGSRMTKDNPYYSIAEEIAFRITQLGFGVITGGGPGVMEAGNKGAQRGNGKSVGLGIDIFHEKGLNDFVDNEYSLNFDYFFARKVMFVKYSQGFVVMPGGLGTMDELFEALTLIQTYKTGRFPIIMVGKDFWGGLIDWMKEKMLAEGYISEDDFELYRLVDTAEEAASHIEAFYNKYAVKTNF